MGIIKIRYYSPDALRITEAQTSPAHYSAQTKHFG